MNVVWTWLRIRRKGGFIFEICMKLEVTKVRPRRALHINKASFNIPALDNIKAETKVRQCEENVCLRQIYKRYIENDAYDWGYI